MRRVRKKYLVYRKDGEGERELAGIYSSGKRAASAVRADCSKTRTSIWGTLLLGIPFIERNGDVTRLVVSPDREILYSIEILCEDEEIIK